MATYDNKIWLLKNIRAAFIATDDTGLCEIVMAGEDFSKIFQNKVVEDKKCRREGRIIKPGPSKCKDLSMGDISEDENEKEVVTQFEPYPDFDSEDDDISPPSYIRTDDLAPGGYRQRSNTAQWLDKKEQAIKRAAKIKVIKWEDFTPLTPEQSLQMFTRVEVKPPVCKKSLLTEQLEKCPDLPHRHYLDYAKFDGTAQMRLATKKFKIFMTMLPEKYQNYPLVVCVIANAKIRDLIGFTCYKYSIDHPDVALGSVHDYGLCIAEDDGEVDWAFPCLDANEPCSKFGFTCLGLVDLKSKNALTPTTSSIPEDGFLNAFHVFPKAADSSHSQNNPSRHNTGGSATSEAVISAIKAVAEDKKGGESERIKLQSHIIVTEAPQYKAYTVQMLRKVRTNTLVQLCISIDRIEVEPLVTHKHAFWLRSKYFHHNIDTVAWCQILESRGSKTTFRIVYSPGHILSLNERNNTDNQSMFHPNTTYKYHDFECDNDIAREIVEKVNAILDLRNSPCRREYKTAKEKKLQSRRNFHTKQLS